jgi:hypothetical protein
MRHVNYDTPGLARCEIDRDASAICDLVVRTRAHYDLQMNGSRCVLPVIPQDYGFKAIVLRGLNRGEKNRRLHVQS